MSGECGKALQTCKPRRIRMWFRRVISWLRGDDRPENSKLYQWAKRELDRLQASAGDCEMQRLMNKQVLDIVRLFCTHGHSGFSAGYAINMIKRLCDWKPIMPLTGAEDEWGEPGSYGDGYNTSQQNLRCSAVFRDNGDNATAHYLYGKSFSDNGGHTWFTRGGKASVHRSSMPVTFPFVVPDKPEYVYLNGEDSDEVLDAVKDKERIAELYKAWDEKYSDRHAE